MGLDKRVKLLFLFLIVSLPLVAKPLVVEVNAKSAILMNANTGKVLFEKNATSCAFPASVTKMATALYLLELEKDLEKMVVPSLEALRVEPLLKSASFHKIPYRLAPDGTMMGIKKGEELSIRSLLYGMLLASGNDAANVLAESVGGSIPRFIEGLNRFLIALGCKETHFCNPHGYHHPEHVTTAYDLALITRYVINNEDLKKISTSLMFTCPKTNKSPARDILQTNRLMKQGKYFYPYVLFSKTGYHSASGSNLSVAAEKNGRRIIAILLGCDTYVQRYEDAITLLEAAFQEEVQERLIVSKQKLFARHLRGGATPLVAQLSADLNYYYFDSEEEEAKAFVCWDELFLPIEKGARVGAIRLFGEGGRVLSEEPIYAVERVEKTLWKALKDFVSRFI